jgi:TIR domain/Pentapeptide repeats (8 copies)
MDRDEALKLLTGGKEGIRAWNDHRKKGGEIPSLAGADLTRADLTGADLTEAKLTRAVLSEARLTGADLTWTDLTGADLIWTDLTAASFAFTTFGNLDLSRTRGLDKVVHDAPSTVGMDTISRSKGQIPEAFLRGCGLAPWEVLSANFSDPTLTPPQIVEIQYEIFDAWTKGKDMINGCFISYSWKDSKFVEKLRDRLIAEKVNVWLDKHDMVAGTIQDQVWRAIQLHHVVVLVLSEHSVRSDWVENELDMARRKEKAEGRAVLCPVALDDTWRAKLDATAGPGDANRALWRTLDTKLVMDFSPWKTKAFDGTFGKLVRGLKVNYGPKDPPVS